MFSVTLAPEPGGWAHNAVCCPGSPRQRARGHTFPAPHRTPSARHLEKRHHSHKPPHAIPHRTEDFELLIERMWGWIWVFLATSTSPDDPHCQNHHLWAWMTRYIKGREKKRRQGKAYRINIKEWNLVKIPSPASYLSMLTQQSLGRPLLLL